MSKILWTVILCNLLTAWGLFVIKHKVLVLQKTISAIKIKEQNIISNIAILRNELSFVTHPSRVEQLIRTFLPHLQNLDTHQIIPLSCIAGKKVQEDCAKPSNKRPPGLSSGKRRKFSGRGVKQR